MTRRSARPPSLAGAPIFVAVRRRSSWARLAAPAGLSLVVVGIALAIGGVATVWWLVVSAGLLVTLIGLLGDAPGEHARWRSR